MYKEFCVYQLDETSSARFLASVSQGRCGSDASAVPTHMQVDPGLPAPSTTVQIISFVVTIESCIGEGDGSDHIEAVCKSSEIFVLTGFSDVLWRTLILPSFAR